MSAEEKRDCVRFSIQRVVDFTVKNRVYRGSIENNSDCGVFIKTKKRFSDRFEGRDISMTIESPKFGSEERTGKITRVTPEGIGVEFNYPGYTR